MTIVFITSPLTTPLSLAIRCEVKMEVMVDLCSMILNNLSETVI